MRRALVPATLPALLLLAGCTVFQAGRNEPQTGGWEQHDGYSLRCDDVERADCERRADSLATAHRSQRDAPILSIVIGPGPDSTLCWGSTAGNQCRSAEH